jgi:hypothetical protein
MGPVPMGPVEIGPVPIGPVEIGSWAFAAAIGPPTASAPMTAATAAMR